MNCVNADTAIFATLCCCCLCGLLAIYYAMRAKNEWAAGNRPGAREHNRISKFCSGAAIITDTVLTIIFVIVLISFRESIFYSSSSRYHSSSSYRKTIARIDNVSWHVLPTNSYCFAFSSFSYFTNPSNMPASICSWEFDYTVFRICLTFCLIINYFCLFISRVYLIVISCSNKFIIKFKTTWNFEYFTNFYIILKFITSSIICCTVRLLIHTDINTILVGN